MPAKSEIQWLEVPRTAALRIVPQLPGKTRWDGVTTYQKASEVLPWLQQAFSEAMKANLVWGNSGIPVGYVGPFFSIEGINGHFQVVGASASHGPYITWFSPWSNTQWSMYLKTVRVIYKGSRPIKNG